MTVDVNVTIDEGAFTDEEVMEALLKMRPAYLTDHSEPVPYCDIKDIHFCYPPSIIKCAIDFDEAGNVAEIDLNEEVIKELLEKEDTSEENKEEKEEEDEHRSIH
ncbi:gp029 (endogenous virus) [Lactococcus phage KSY1]|uniref:Gp029 n=1 Tax=Lactococcus phage KSY1 TaxID=2913972 RepID=A6MA93_9CAUD|nr:gp029 [Lactococcus phage KSY1]ABG21571.1 gp029 [Lactococcus phage KSY1]